MILIPTFNPNDQSLKFLISLFKKKIFERNNIIILNDGSFLNESKKIYENINNLGIKVIHSNYNYGKGAMIKEGIKYAKSIDSKYVIVADGDGQHLVKDIDKIKNSIDKNYDLIIGCRNFNVKNIPIRNKLSNKFINLIINLLLGYKFKDSQCGLRYINNKLFDLALNIEANKFNFEIEFLLNVKNKFSIKEIPIETVYDKKNYQTNFKYLSDSYSIIKSLIKFYYFKNSKNKKK